MRRVAVLLASGVLATACGAGGASAARESVPACTAVAVAAIEHHVTLTTTPAACRGLSRAELNFALGRAIYQVAGAGQHKTAWRDRAAAAGARLAWLIQPLRLHPVPAPPRAGSPAPGPGPPSRWPTGLATLAAWLLTVGSGAFMLAGWIRRGGLRPRGGRSRLGPAVPLGHFGVASSGLLAWIAYLATGWTALGWLAVAVLLAAIGLGMATLTVWTAQASRARAAPARLAAGPPRRTAAPPRRSPSGLRIIVPVVHGLTASATILLALLTAVSAR